MSPEATIMTSQSTSGAPTPSGRRLGGKTIYGAALGILMLHSRFPRVHGDMGNALTWPFPVMYKVVRGASPDRVVRQQAEGLLPAFIDAARHLVDDGADGITTNCGFLSLFQAELQATVPVPVASSSLMQVPLVQATLPAGKRVGIVTICARTLTDAHLKAAGVPAGTPVTGTDETGPFARPILNDEPELDVNAARADLLHTCRTFAQQNPDLGAIVLECTNMTPYQADITTTLGLPVYSIYNLATWFHAALSPPKMTP